MVTGGDSICRVSSDGGGDSRVVDLRWGRRKGTIGLVFLVFFFFVDNNFVICKFEC